MSLLRSVSPPPSPLKGVLIAYLALWIFLFLRADNPAHSGAEKGHAKELVRNGPLNPPTFFRVPFFRTPRVSKTHLSFNSAAPNQAAIERERGEGRESTAAAATKCQKTDREERGA